MRVSTAFNRMLDLEGASVRSVEFSADGIVVGVVRTARRHRCPCGSKAPVYDRAGRRRWRHIDACGSKLWLEADLVRVRCRRCDTVRTEAVPWARPRARFTRDLEDVIAWLCQRTDKTAVTRLLRVSWEAVQAVVERVVAERIDDRRLDGVFRLGVDEISYKRGHHYLTVVADQDSGKVLYVAEGRSQAALVGFFEELGPSRCEQVTAISMDMAPIWQAPCAEHIPQAAICFDPFHIIRWANDAVDKVFRAASQALSNGTGGRDWRRARYVIRAGVERLGPRELAILARIRSNRLELFEAWELKEELRALFQTVDPDEAPSYLATWIVNCKATRSAPMVTLARRIERHFDGIVNTVRHRISNSRLEGINAKIRLINKRGFGHPNADHLAAMIHLCLGGITVPLPTQT